MKPDGGLTYSKKLPIITGVIFAFVVVFCLVFGNGYEMGTVYVTAITVSGGCFTGVLVSYLRKAQAENVYKLDVASYKDKSEVELSQLEKIVELQKKYGITEDDIIEARMKSSLDEMLSEDFQKVRNNIDNAKTDTQINEMDFKGGI